jgi:hypothetical protein
MGIAHVYLYCTVALCPRVPSDMSEAPDRFGSALRLSANVYELHGDGPLSWLLALAAPHASDVPCDLPSHSSSCELEPIDLIHRFHLF